MPASAVRAITIFFMNPPLMSSLNSVRTSCIACSSFMNLREALYSDDIHITGRAASVFSRMRESRRALSVGGGGSGFAAPNLKFRSVRFASSAATFIIMSRSLLANHCVVAQDKRPPAFAVCDSLSCAVRTAGNFRLVIGNVRKDGDVRYLARHAQLSLASDYDRILEALHPDVSDRNPSA